MTKATCPGLSIETGAQQRPGTVEYMAGKRTGQERAHRRLASDRRLHSVSALHDAYVESVNAALERGDERLASELADGYPEEYHAVTRALPPTTRAA